MWTAPIHPKTNAPRTAKRITRNAITKDYFLDRSQLGIPGRDGIEYSSDELKKAKVGERKRSQEPVTWVAGAAEKDKNNGS
jgi:hypothetical protein